MRLIKYILYLLVLLAITACVSQPEKMTEQPLGFKEAVRNLTDNLLQQVKKHQGLSVGKKQIALDPFIDVNSGDVVQTSLDIESLVIDHIDNRFPKFSIQRLSPTQLENIQYIMVGALDYELFGNEGNQKRYRIHASVLDPDTQKVVANAKVWLLEDSLDYTPVTIYEDSPMYLKDKLLDSLISIAKSPTDADMDARYYEALEASAMIIEASTAYAERDFGKALDLFQQASALQEGQTMRTYAGLYQTYRKLQHPDKAEDAFGKMFELGVEEDNLSTKFLFQVNNVEFVKNPNIRKQYVMWLRQIGKFFNSTEHCIQILGHTSRTGAEKYNRDLSLQRAQKVQKLLAPYLLKIQKRSEAIGRGYLDNIVGSGTDDARDAVDRRVDFKIVGCEL
ncbi:OmpA family protein [Candidatus Albibeggiatoa sp. nov. NOAA]|uniref:OmpA family protein n=1 Tax=Candidatus Albibeggiatoa sp. nov. NOAA TaxID=3162724 RepID=UPI0032FBD947|nr:OmpA family protein [Thiotrichaceae bacterium]